MRIALDETAPNGTVPDGLPGAELVAKGLEALHRGQPTLEALLVLVGAPRLRWAGVDVPDAPKSWGEVLANGPELALYGKVAASCGRDAHSQYNALIRRLVSFERALERVRRRTPRRTP